MQPLSSRSQSRATRLEPDRWLGIEGGKYVGAYENLKWLEDLKSKARELHEEEEAAKKTIRDEFVEQTIMFIDVVGSTAFKVANQANPEIWILRVKQFCEMIRFRLSIYLLNI